MCKFVSREFALIALACCAAQFSVAQNAPAASAEIEQHIQHVEAGLVGDVVIKGDDARHPQLADRMKELNVPGVSIAVIHEGKIEWARGFGVSSVGGPPVTCGHHVSGRLHQQAAGGHGRSPAGRSRASSSLDADINTYLTSLEVSQRPGGRRQADHAARAADAHRRHHRARLPRLRGD